MSECADRLGRISCEKGDRAARANMQFKATGTNGKRKPRFVTAGPPMIDVNAAAPRGGWRLRVKDMARMAGDTPKPIARIWSLTRCATRTPTNAEMVLPPMMDQG